MFDALSLTSKGMPPRVYVTAQDGSYSLVGSSWKRVTQTTDTFGSIILTAPSTTDEPTAVKVNFEAPEQGLYEVAIYSPTVLNASSSAAISVQHEYGVDAAGVKQREFSRWHVIGDYYFEKGMNTAALTIKPSINEQGKVIVFNALRFSKYPYCGNAPGQVC